jgi:hypothetical protein
MIDQRGQPLGSVWWIYSGDGGVAPRLFSGSLQEVVAHINALHRAEGVSFAARELRTERRTAGRGAVTRLFAVP